MAIPLILLVGYCSVRIFLKKTAVPKGLEDYHVYVPRGADLQQVADSLVMNGFIKPEAEPLFVKLAEEMEYAQDPMRSGRYLLEAGWSMVDLVRHLRSGEQATVRFTLTHARLPEDIALRAAKTLEPNEEAFLKLFNDPDFIRVLGYSPETFISIFIPNTYQLYWDSTPEAFVKRMAKEHDKFWERDNRKAKAQALGMTPIEVYTMASIVEKETNKNQEKPTIAGVYLNRIRKGMRLQADPTAVFARRDFNTRRVTWYHTKYDSPYNTYLYKGLPPGPICMASIASIDAVLNAEDHDYIFFCARGDGSGLHEFAESLAGHNSNVRAYQRNLKKRGKR